MWAGRRTGKGKGQRDRVGKTSIRTESFQARVTDLDPIRVSPYGPAACHLPHREAGHTTAPDRMHRTDQKLLASTGASTHVRRPGEPEPEVVAVRRSRDRLGGRQRGTAAVAGNWSATRADSTHGPEDSTAWPNRYQRSARHLECAGLTGERVTSAAATTHPIPWHPNSYGFGRPGRLSARLPIRLPNSTVHQYRE